MVEKLKLKLIQSIYGTSKPRWFFFYLINDSFPSVLSSYCAEVIVHLTLPRDSGSAMESSFFGYVVHFLEDKVGFFSANFI